MDAHPQNGVVMVLLSVLTMRAANTSVMHNSDQITVELPYLQNHQSLMLCWRSFSEWGGVCVAVSTAYTSCKYIGYENQRPNHGVITVLT
jgi:hypothetical protein